MASVMNKISKIIVPVAMAAVTLVACQKEVDNPRTDVQGSRQITVIAAPEALKGEATKTYIDSEKKIIWGTGEVMRLAVTAEETTNFYDATDSECNGQEQAHFSFTVPDVPGSLFQGLYPASAAATSTNTNPANYKVNLPAIQDATASSYDPAAYIMVAKPESFDVLPNQWNTYFRRGTALNKITLKNLPSGVSINKVKITAEGKKLAGGRHFNLSTGEGSDVYGTEPTIEVHYATPLSGTNVDVWFTSWDVEIAESEKLTIVAYTTDKKSYTKEITVPAGRTIKFQEGYLNTLGANLSGINPETVSEFAEGDYVILAKNNNTYYALKGEVSGTRIASVNYTGSLTNYSGDASLVWTIAASGSSYTIKNDGNYVGWSSGNSADLVAEADYDATKCLMGIDDNGDGTYKIYVTADPSRLLARNQSNEYFAFYGGTQYKDIVFVPATALEAVATPTFSPAAGEVASGDQVTISCATSGATIHYTVDGTDPTSSSTTYSSPITITATTTIKAIAVKEGMADSEIATATYTVPSAGSITLTASDITAGDNTVQGTNSGALAYRLGTSNNNGSITFEAGYSSITFTLAGWASGTRSFTVTNGKISGSSSLSPAAGSPSGSINANFSTTYTGTEYTIDVDDPTQEVVFSGRRCVVWGFTAVAAGPSVTWNLESIAVTTEPTTTVYTAGESFDPAGMVVTAHYVDADDATNTKDEAVTGYTITPSGALAVTDDHVTITYQGKTTTQAITVNAAPVVSYDFETVAELNALVTSTSAEYSGYLTDAVVSFVPATNTAIVKDATGSVMFYKSNHGLKQGQTYTGAINVTAIQYNSLYSEITAWDATFTGTETVVSPESVSLADLIGNYDDYQNAYVSVAGLTVSSVDGKNINVTDGTNNYVVFYNPGTATVSAGEVITAVGTITKYQTTEEIKVWKAADITVTAAAPKAITFTQPAAGGSFTVQVDGNNITSGTTVASGKTVTLTATAASGYSFNGWSVSGATVADASATSTTFTMGTSAVTVAANFKQEGSTTTTEEISSGSFTGDANSISFTTASGITISQLKNGSTNVNTTYNTVSTLRVYRANQMQFTGKTFTKIEMYYTGNYSGADWSVVNGGGSVTIDTTNKKVVWTNSAGASTVTLQNSTSNGTNTQLRTTKFYFEY